MSQQAVEKGRAVQDLIKMEGWTYLKANIDQEIANAVEELRQIDIQGKTLEQIGVKFVELQKLIDGLSRTQEIVTEMLEEMEQSANE